MRLRKERGGGAAELRLPESLSPELMDTLSEASNLPEETSSSASSSGGLAVLASPEVKENGEVQDTVVSVRDMSRRSSKEELVRVTVETEDAYVDRIVLKVI